MKPFPAGLDTLLATGTFVYCDLYDFTLWDGSHVRYATSDTDVLYGGNTYTSKGPYFDTVANKSLAHWKAGLDLDAWIVQLAPAPVDPITGATFPAKLFNQPWLAAVRAGALRGATVDIHRAYWAKWPTRPLTATSTSNVFTTLNPALLAANVTLSGGNLVATYTDAVTRNTAARSVLSESAGKFYCEFAVVLGGGGEALIGICNAAQLITDGMSTTLNAIALDSGGSVFINNVVVATPALSYTTGDVIDMAVDFAAQNIWFRKNGGSWNNSGAADPATNAGGISFSTLNAGPYTAAFELLTNTTQITVNFGATAYSFAAPSGFTSWFTVVTSALAANYLTPDYVLVDIFAGRVAEIDVTRSEATITINSFVEILSRPMPRNLYQAPCRWTLFDAGCAIADTSFKANGAVLAVLAQNAITSSGIATLGNVDGYYALGRLLWLTGGNVGFPLAIRNSQVSNGTLEFIRPAPFPIVVGDTFTAYAGCDKTQATCIAKFGNKVNFAGFPYIPQAETGV